MRSMQVLRLIGLLARCFAFVSWDFMFPSIPGWNSPGCQPASEQHMSPSWHEISNLVESRAGLVPWTVRIRFEGDFDGIPSEFGSKAFVKEDVCHLSIHPGNAANS